jgi:hypothetical protein
MAHNVLIKKRKLAKESFKAAMAKASETYPSTTSIIAYGEGWKLEQEVIEEWPGKSISSKPLRYIRPGNY